MKWYQYLVFLVVWRCANVTKTVSNRLWTWECKNHHCQKVRVTQENRPYSLATCQISCDPFGTLLPSPTGIVELGGSLVIIDIFNSRVNENHAYKTSSLLRAAYSNFESRVTDSITPERKGIIGKPLIVTLNIEDLSQTQLKLNTNESYALRITKSEDGGVNATISAPTFFGGRHGLETLSQLIIYDDILKKLRIPNQVYITDKPIYPYRGLLLDTARHYITVNTIKRTIDGMSASKLNTFHWHITDSQSFPYVSKSNPFLSKLGAYSPSQVYTPRDIENIVEYARERGVRVLPEFSAPAHVGEGWQATNFIVCFKNQPWSQYCDIPPCGQFDPTQPKLYDVLEGIYKDMIKQFDPDMFHMGGHQVKAQCWNSSEHVRNWMKSHGWSLDEAGYIQLWNMFQTQALERFDRQAKEKLPIIMWTSNLTKKQYVNKYLPKDRYIIQIWTSGRDQQIKELVEEGYRLILSNHDALYLECGLGNWAGEGNHWCSYNGWKNIYDNSPARYENTKQILGAETVMWTEQTDELTIENRIWPRTAALAEIWWSNPKSIWKYADLRMSIHRERLINRGIEAESVHHRWCEQNEDHCPRTSLSEDRQE